MGPIPLGEEEVQRMRLAVYQAQTAEIDVLAVSRVDAAEDDHQLTVDVHPHVVVADELELLGARCVVGEVGVQLKREVEGVVGVAARA